MAREKARAVYNLIVSPAKRARRTPSTVQRRVITQLEKALAQVHSRHRGRATLRVRAESVLSTLAGVNCAILIANNFGRYVHMNDRAIRLTGYSEAELRRSAVWDLTPEVDLAEARQMWRAFLRQGRMQGPYVIQHKDGRKIPVEYVAVANVLPGLHVSLLPTRRTRAAVS